MGSHHSRFSDLARRLSLRLPTSAISCGRPSPEVRNKGAFAFSNIANEGASRLPKKVNERPLVGSGSKTLHDCTWVVALMDARAFSGRRELSRSFEEMIKTTVAS